MLPCRSMPSKRNPSRTLPSSYEEGSGHRPTVSRGIIMGYVVTEDCIRCKRMDCVEICPVNCFYEGANMLVIHPEECIDCGVCEAECPEEAILPSTDPRSAAWTALNAQYASRWPVILKRGRAPDDADDFHGVPDKCTRYFDSNPGQR